METPKFQRDGPFEAWNAAACKGQVRWADGETDPALAQLGPEGAGRRALERARGQARDFLGLTLHGVLCLVSVAEVEGRIAWIYEPVEGVGLNHFSGVDAEHLLSAKQAASAVAQVAGTLNGMGRLGLRHPGPAPRDLLLTRDGSVRVAGFSSPFPPPPAYRTPEGEREAGTAVVYRLGVLLATLISGNSPPPPSTEASHPALVRRVIIRAMARPGPPLPERYADWLRGMLAWDAGRRPPLSAVSARLGQLADSIPGPSLMDAAAELTRRVEASMARQTPAPTPGMRRRRPDQVPILGGLAGHIAGDLAEEEEDMRTEVANDTEVLRRRRPPGQVVASLSVPPARPRLARPEREQLPPRRGQEPGLRVEGRITSVDEDPLEEAATGIDDEIPLLPPPEEPETFSGVDHDEFLDDDPTQEASGLELDLESSPPPPRRPWNGRPAGEGSMPIGVGPPAEAVPTARTTLPPELVALADDESLPPPPLVVEREASSVRQAAMPAVLWVAWAGLVGLLLVLVILLASYLVWPRPSEAEAPQRSVAEALQSASVNVVSPSAPSTPALEARVVAEPPGEHAAPAADEHTVVAVGAPAVAKAGPPYTVRFTGPDADAWLEVTCQGQQARGQGSVSVELAQGSPCVAVSDGRRAHLAVDRSGTARCFSDGARCFYE